MESGERRAIRITSAAILFILFLLLLLLFYFFDLIDNVPEVFLR